MVVDTSAVVAVLFGEPGAEGVANKLMDAPCIMSAATRVELGIVVEARAGPAGAQLLEEPLARVGVRVEPVDQGLADEALVCRRRFGRGGTRRGSTAATRSRTHWPAGWGCPCSSWERTSPAPTCRAA
ncbi:MAG: type II toxin-antitoxin system VapC family toxin [Acidimicrobiaceae bacterium]|nr:type II toxin-antitoxin system VapC family toxin [Acidimicrobiaceae bacterium]